MTRLSLLPIALVAAFPAGPLPGRAQTGDARDDVPADYQFARDAVARGDFLPLETILGIVARDYPGQVVEIELEMDDGVWEYEVEIVTPDGRLIEVDLAASDGSILEVEDADDD